MTSESGAALWEATGTVPWLDQAGSSQPITSNLNGADLPFQRWFHFKEAFSPRFVAEVIASCKSKPKTCIDPFGGCGTTALTCQFLGVRSTTIEVNPFLVDLIEAKLTHYESDLVIADRVRLADQVASSDKRTSEEVRRYFEGAPTTLVEPGTGGRWIFDAGVAERIIAYRESIQQIDNAAHRRLFRVLLASILVDVSNVLVNGKGRRYRTEVTVPP